MWLPVETCGGGVSWLDGSGRQKQHLIWRWDVGGRGSVNGRYSRGRADTPRAMPGRHHIGGWQEVVKLAKKEQPQRQEKDQGGGHRGSQGKLWPTASKATTSGETRKMSGRVSVKPER